MFDTAHLRDGNSAQIFAVRRYLEILEKANRQSSINRRRLLRIVEGMFSLRVRGRLSSRKTPLALLSPQTTTGTIPTSQGPRHVDPQQPRTQIPLVSVLRSATSVPFRDLHPLPSWLASSKLIAPKAPTGSFRTRQHQVVKPNGQQIGQKTPAVLQVHRSPTIQSVVRETNIHVLASRRSGFDPTLGKSPSLSEHIRSKQVRHRAGAAPVGYGYVGDGRLDTTMRHSNTPTRAISTASQSRVVGWSKPWAAKSDLNGYEESNERTDRTGRGDLYLEGSVLGRWFAQHLNREVIRPRAGIMAVDPRMTPSWGGPFPAM
jgi:hypothetical protein